MIEGFSEAMSSALVCNKFQQNPYISISHELKIALNLAWSPNFFFKALKPFPLSN